MATFHTVSEEMAWTDWSAPAEKPQQTHASFKPSLLSIAATLIAGLLALAAIIYLLPAY